MRKSEQPQRRRAAWLSQAYHAGGGIGNIRADHVQKGEIGVGAKLIVLGGPAMNIGLGGGAASSMLPASLMRISILPPFSAITRKWNAVARK
ncbi:phosphoribosylformylglycinamidine synthase [Salmonella enterica subsp. arizonae]|uniref:Phosphoribosylformylglycinamidine synthase n=1 Tax=Salmonella enterica subsp. arizonae TaxID=59203 RepID=A0A379SQS4_SALER|nr:phosphoribosylformylglycinamidine synthase [Salmonella enterica subsp. arizonae]